MSNHFQDGSARPPFFPFFAFGDAINICGPVMRAKRIQMSMGPNTAWYVGLSGRGMALGLDNEAELLERLGRPQDRLRILHVAGTDGKGSVCSMIESILLASGASAGMFTSPEILSICECIRIGGRDIEQEDLESVLGTVRGPAEEMEAEGRPCTSFEVLTAAALTAFVLAGSEFAVVEVGMGGRLDATNVVVPESVVINNIELEHTAFLGSTVEEIASEKAGIMKPGVPCVTMNPDPVFAVLERHASEIGCPLRRILSEDVGVLSMDPCTVVADYHGEAFEIGLPGRHQARNAVLAMAALYALPDFEERFRPNLHRGLEEASWPCRMQKLLADPVVVDVTHTVGGARCLASDIEEIYGRAVLVIGMLSDKDADGVAEALSRVADRAFVAAPVSPRAMPAERLAEIVSRHIRVEKVCASVEEAMDAALESRGDEIVLATGSFRTAEGVLRWLESRSFRFSTPSPGSTWAERIRAGTRRA